MSGGEVRLVDLVKAFGAQKVVDGLNLRISPGEFFSILGSSGCGKTTTLRLIAGFEQPSSGHVLLDGVDMTNTPPNRRNVNTVFQHYALFPHLDVFDNVAFGPRRARVDPGEVKRRVGEALELVQLAGYEKRKPAQLSGGQQQRVALARSLVLKPAVLLLDEPLGALDAKLRKQLQAELKALQRQVGITFIYVTHDQEEALTMSDRIAVMSRGRVEQVAAPREVYEEPASVFVADFLGVSNLMSAMAGGMSGVGGRMIRLGNFELRAECGDGSIQGRAKITIRPERVRIEPRGSGGENRIPGTIERCDYLGSAMQLVVRLVTGDLIHVQLQNTGEPLEFPRGAAVHAHLPAGALRVLADPGEDDGKG